MKRHITILCSIAIGILAGCEPGDLVVLPVSSPKIVMISDNVAGDRWFVGVSQTFPINAYVYDIRSVPGARVMIYENDTLLEELTEMKQEPPFDKVLYGPLTFYSFKNTAVPGHTYKAVVEADGFTTATASYTQPEFVPVLDASFTLKERRVDTITYKIQRDNKILDQTTIAYHLIFNVTITFTDPRGDNYYDFVAGFSDVEDFKTSDNSREGALYNGLDRELFSSGEYLGISDAGISERTVTMNFQQYYDFFSHVIPDDSTLPIPNYFRVGLRTISKDLYDYKQQASRAQRAAGDPYAQPITTQSTVENGLGVFGGYTPSWKTFYFDVTKQ